MPIYIKVEGVKGNVTNAGNGGVWKTTNFLAGGTANRKGGLRVAVGDLDSAAPSNAIEVASISLPKTPVYSIVIDGRDAHIAVKTRMMFEAQKSGGTFTLTFQGQVTGAANNIQTMNNLRQIAISGGTIPLIKLFVGNGGNSNRAGYELENCLITSYSNGAGNSGGGTSESLSINFTKITYNIPTSKD